MKYAHIRRNDGGVNSFGYNFVKDTGKVYVQVAKCKATDQFSRPKAHWICEGRMKKYGPAFELSVTNPSEIYPALQKLAV